MCFGGGAMALSERVIPIYPVADAAPLGGGVAEALMREIASALARYAQDRAVHVIDLTGMPLSEDDRKRLDGYLGQGETSIDIHAIMHTHIEETRYAGVWRVRHCEPDGDVRSERIEIVDVPEIVRASEADIGRSVQRLAVGLSEEGM